MYDGGLFDAKKIREKYKINDYIRFDLTKLVDSLGSIQVCEFVFESQEQFDTLDANSKSRVAGYVSYDVKEKYTVTLDSSFDALYKRYALAKAIGYIARDELHSFNKKSIILFNDDDEDLFAENLLVPNYMLLKVINKDKTLFKDYNRLSQLFQVPVELIKSKFEDNKEDSNYEEI